MSLSKMIPDIALSKFEIIIGLAHYGDFKVVIDIE